MSKRLSTRGQNIAEYAVLFAIVIGAAFAMQNFIKQRLQGAMAYHANGYLAATTADDAGVSANRFEPTRETWSGSTSSSSLGMQTVRAGTVDLNSLSNANVLTTKQ